MIRIRNITILVAAVFLVPVARGQDDVLSSVPEKYRSGVSRALSGSKGPAFRASFAKLDEEERVGWAFLLANMPHHRMSDLTEEILTDHVKHAYRARREFAWTKALPEDVFLHYVLPILSGDEKIEAYRSVLWDEIVPRLKKKRCKSLEQVALEVNRFCGSKVTFKPTPPEDSSPLEVMKRGYGRCEEEGIFFNAVARTAGLPARVASTPYWTFKASNHAWCEVYTGPGRGRNARSWHFLGACEPSGKLDQAWFVGDVKRAAVVLSRCIGTPESEQILSTRGTTSIINTTRYYTKTCEMTVAVVDGEGAPAQKASIALYIFNEVGNDPRLHDAFQAETDADGKLTFDLGPGDYVLSAKKGSSIGWAIASSKPGKKAECRIVLGEPGCVEGKRKPGPTGIRIALGRGMKKAHVGICKVSKMPWKPDRSVDLEGPGQTVELSPGTYLLQSGRRKGDAEVHVTLQVVTVEDGEVVTIEIPGTPRKRGGNEGGMYVLSYPR